MLMSHRLQIVALDFARRRRLRLDIKLREFGALVLAFNLLLLNNEGPRIFEIDLNQRLFLQVSYPLQSPILNIVRKVSEWLVGARRRDGVTLNLFLIHSSIHEVALCLFAGPFNSDLRSNVRLPSLLLAAMSMVESTFIWWQQIWWFVTRNRQFVRLYLAVWRLWSPLINFMQIKFIFS